MQRHGIGQQVQRSPSGSTPHDRVSIPQICSSHSPTLDRPRQSALRYPAVLSNRASTYSVRRQPAPIHAPLRSRTTSAIAPPTISHSARGTQIPITHAAPPTYPFPRFSPLEVCGRRPRCARHHLHGAGIRKPSQRATSTRSRMAAPSAGDRKLKKSTPRLAPGRPQPSAVGFDDRTADRESHSHTAGFSGEEGVEQPVSILGGDPDAAIHHTYQHVLCLFLARSDHQYRAMGQPVSPGLRLAWRCTRRRLTGWRP